MIPGSAHALTLGGDPCEQYQIGHSVRFNAVDTPYLTRTYGVATHDTTWALSWWQKRTALSGASPSDTVWSKANGASGDGLGFDSGDRLLMAVNGATVAQWAPVFRDFSAHDHFLLVVDTTQGVQADRAKLYLNGALQSQLSCTLSLSQVFRFADAAAAYIGTWIGAGPRFNSNFLLSEIQYVNGLSPVPADFGFTCPTTGQWRPKKYAGAYGTGGFYLDFSDGSAATAGALGADRSGNGNNWTPTNISVTAGAGNDWLEDTTSNNFATLNALSPVNSVATLANGALDATTGTTGILTKPSTFSMASGKWYWEVTPASGTEWYIGIVPASYSADGQLGAAGGGYSYSQNANKWSGGTNTAYGATFTIGDVIGVAFDSDAGTLTFYKNGVSQGQAFSGITGDFFAIASDSSAASGSGLTFNFGQRAFAYTPPAGFKALCTKNLPKSGTVSVSGSFTGNANADGPFVAMNGTPTTLTINGNAVTFGTHADALANGFKVRTSSASYNAAGANTWTATIASNVRNLFRNQNAKGN